MLSDQHYYMVERFCCELIKTLDVWIKSNVKDLLVLQFHMKIINIKCLHFK